MTTSISSIEINSCFIILRFLKLSFGFVSTLTYAPYLEHAIKDHNLDSKLSFKSIWTLACAKFINYVVKTQIKHKRLWKRIILNEEFIENQEYIIPNLRE